MSTRSCHTTPNATSSPIASITTIILAISAPASLKAGSLDELVALIRAQPGKLNAAAASGNSHFLLFGFLQGSGLQVARVPYRDIMQAPNDLAEGRIHLLATSLTVVLPQMQTGKVKVLAVTSRQRAASAPDVPTAVEAGYPALELESPIGVFGPRGMSGELRERVAEDLRAVVAADPGITTRLAATGQAVAVRGPSRLRRHDRGAAFQARRDRQDAGHQAGSMIAASSSDERWSLLSDFRGI